jgi:hypothetical protein
MKQRQDKHRWFGCENLEAINVQGQLASIFIDDLDFVWCFGIKPISEEQQGILLGE